MPTSCACLLKANNICNISVFLLVTPAGTLSNWTSSLGNREQTNWHFLLFYFYIPSFPHFFSSVGLHPSTLFYFLSFCSPAIWGSVPPEIPSSLPLTNLHYPSFPFSLYSSSAVGLFATHKLYVYWSLRTVHWSYQERGTTEEEERMEIFFGKGLQKCYIWSEVRSLKGIFFPAVQTEGWVGFSYFWRIIVVLNMSRVKLLQRASVSLVTSGQDDCMCQERSGENREIGWGRVLLQ